MNYKEKFSGSDAFLNYPHKYKAYTKAEEWKLLFGTKRTPYSILFDIQSHDLFINIIR
jgi:hypothetical protein